MNGGALFVNKFSVRACLSSEVNLIFFLLRYVLDSRCMCVVVALAPVFCRSFHCFPVGLADKPSSKVAIIRQGWD